jgi:hypothetical protein
MSLGTTCSLRLRYTLESACSYCIIITLWGLNQFGAYTQH